MLKNIPETKPGFVWIRKENGEVVDICSTYPLHPEAVAVPRDHPDVLQTLAEHKAARDELAQRRAAVGRVLTRLADAEAAKG